MPVSIEEYRDHEYEPACDCVDGELVDRNAGLHPHSLMLVERSVALPVQAGHAMYPILRMQVSPTRIRVADMRCDWTANQGSGFADASVHLH